MDMQQRTVVVTGGASGIGKATAFLIVRAGRRVLIGDVDQVGGRAAEAEAQVQQLPIQYFPLDLTNKTSIDDFVATVHRQVEPIDGLVNGAGWDQIQPFLENPPEMWHHIIAVNLMGAVRRFSDVLPRLFFMAWWAAAIALIIGALSERTDWVQQIWQPPPPVRRVPRTR